MSVLLGSMSGAFHAAVGPHVSGTWLRSVPLCTDSKCMPPLSSWEVKGLRVGNLTPGEWVWLCCRLLVSLASLITKQREMMSEDQKG